MLEPNERRSVDTLPAYGAEGVRLAGRPSAAGNLLALAQRPDRQVSLFDITDISHPRLKRQYSLEGHPGACAFWKGRLVIPAGYQGLLVERQADKLKKCSWQPPGRINGWPEFVSDTDGL